VKTLKHDVVDVSTYRDLAYARSTIGAFIEGICNRQRLHSSLDYF